MKKLPTIVMCTSLITAASDTAMADDGLSTYNLVCSSCHESAAAGAPMLDDKAEWKPRIAKGADALYASIVNSKCELLVKGVRKDLSDDMIKAAVNYMVSQAK